MQTPSSRREFLKTVSVLSTSLPFATGCVAGETGSKTPTAQISNEFLSLAYDVATGRLNVWRDGGDLFLAGAVARANVGAGPRNSAEAAYQRTVETVPLKDKLGTGRQVVVRCADGARQLDFELRFALYDGATRFWSSVRAGNLSPQPITLRSVEPLCASPEENGACGGRV